jgi:oligopeptide/dipeptide ABC transporter ATP-binding protein
MTNREPLLEIEGLKTYFFTDEGIVKAVDGVDMSITRGHTLCVVGESGCGKSITARSILQIVDRPGKIVEGQILYHRRRTPPLFPPQTGGDERGGASANTVTDMIDLAALPTWGQEMFSIRGKEIAMIFQEPMTSLSPVHTIGFQIIEAIRLHEPMSKLEARNRAIEMLQRVGIPRPDQRVDSYTFELSGGMRQRAMIAMALSCNPQLLIADEPTTALDVTTQAQILDVMLNLKDEFGMSMLFITHDLGVVAEVADDVAVMYLGCVVEQGDVFSIFEDPKHPYTRALLDSIPKVGMAEDERLESIRGMVPNPYNRPSGCPFHTRCNDAMPGICDVYYPRPIILEDGREVRCWLYGEPDETQAPAAQTTAVLEAAVPRRVGRAI